MKRLRLSFCLLASAICLHSYAGPVVFPGYDAQVFDWNNRCNTNSGVALPSTRLAATQFMRDIRVNNLRGSIDRLNFHAGNNAPGTVFSTAINGSCSPQVPFIIDKGSSFDSFAGSITAPTYTEQGQNAGLRANAVASNIQGYNTGYLVTNSASANSFHLMVYITASTNEAGMSLGAQGPADAVHSTYLMPGWSDGKFYASAYNETQFAVDNATSNGFFLATRTAAATLITYTNLGLACATNSGSAGNQSTNAIFVFCRDATSGTRDNISTKTLAGYSIGSGFTAAQAVIYYNAWQRFETALGRNK